MPSFVVVMGGSGSGKNHYIDHNLTDHLVIDVDALANVNDDSKIISARIANIKNDLIKAMSDGVNIAHPTTGVNFKGLENKLKLAKSFGYETTLILIDTDPNVAISNVSQRIASGGHGHGLSNEKIIQTNKIARINYEQLSNNKEIVSSAFIIKGRQIENESLLREFIKSLNLHIHKT